MSRVVGTLVGRWYVTAFALAFLWRASRHLGWRRALLYAVAAFAVGVLAEHGSVHLGFPYTRYAFDQSLRADELFVGDVPLFVPLSYGFLVYFGFATGRLVASGLRRTRAVPRWTEWLVAEVLTVWSLWIIDPVSRLGDRIYLGHLFDYAGPGFWFGLPLGSQAGFALTAGVLIALLTWLARDEQQRPVARWLDHPHLPAALTYVVEVGHIAVVAMIAGAPEIAGAALVVYLPIVALVAVHWSAARREEVA